MIIYGGRRGTRARLKTWPSGLRRCGKSWLGGRACRVRSRLHLRRASVAWARSTTGDPDRIRLREPGSDSAPHRSINTKRAHNHYRVLPYPAPPHAKRKPQAGTRRKHKSELPPPQTSACHNRQPPCLSVGPPTPSPSGCEPRRKMCDKPMGWRNMPVALCPTPGTSSKWCTSRP